MMRTVVLLLLIAAAAAILGMGNLEGLALWMVRALVLVFVVMLIVSAVLGRSARV